MPCTVLSPGLVIPGGLTEVRGLVGASIVLMASAVPMGVGEEKISCVPAGSHDWPPNQTPNLQNSYSRTLTD